MGGWRGGGAAHGGGAVGRWRGSLLPPLRPTVVVTVVVALVALGFGAFRLGVGGHHIQVAHALDEVLLVGRGA